MNDLQRLVENFRREVRDKLSVVANSHHALPMQKAIAFQQCEDFLVEEFDRELRALVFAETAQGWHPIESAPKDGTRILVWRDGAKVTTASYGEHATDPWFCCGYINYKPTHWRELPAPPRASAPSPDK